jgi:hypothetical protein
MALVRKLLDYRWELRGHKVALVDLKNSKEIVIDKVRLMSFMKFAPNCLDKMRIEDTKALRAKIRAIKQANREKKLKRQQSLFAKGAVK